MYLRDQSLTRWAAGRRFCESVGYAARFDANIPAVHFVKTGDRVTVNQGLRLAVSMTKSRIGPSVRTGRTTKMPLATKRWNRMSCPFSLTRIPAFALALTLLTTRVAPSSSFAKADAGDQRPGIVVKNADPEFTLTLPLRYVAIKPTGDALYAFGTTDRTNPGLWTHRG
jgi:hypothetical protein